MSLLRNEFLYGGITLLQWHMHPNSCSGKMCLQHEAPIRWFPKINVTRINAHIRGTHCLTAPQVYVESLPWEMQFMLRKKEEIKMSPKNKYLPKMQLWWSGGSYYCGNFCVNCKRKMYYIHIWCRITLLCISFGGFLICEIIRFCHFICWNANAIFRIFPTMRFTTLSVNST